MLSLDSEFFILPEININQVKMGIINENLKFRRQFIFTNKHTNVQKFWEQKHFCVKGHDWQLVYHEDLEVNTSVSQNKTLILIGYALDPYNPEKSNQDILGDLAIKNSFDEMVAFSAKYTGRYVIIYICNDELLIHNDAVGFRELYYYYKDDYFACGSTPNIIAEYMLVQKTIDPLRIEFFNSQVFREHANTWIGYKTLFDGIMHLAPNHYLDVLKKSTVRFWPKKNLEQLSAEKCAEECSKILEGTIKAAVNRYKIHIGLTAGWDTRLVLASSKNYKDKVFYYVNKLPGYTTEHRDIKIPIELAKKLNLKLNIVDIDGKVDPEFEKYFYENNVLAYNTHLPVFYKVHQNGWDNTYTVSGTMGNAMARIYINFPTFYAKTGENISIAADFAGSQYVVDELSKWSVEVSEICQQNKIRIMDLYQWEQENPNWAALTSSEQDITREEIRPFNNRKLIELFWSVEDKYRYQYNPLIYRKIIKILWKEVLKVPINPGKKDFLYKFLRMIGLERNIYNLYKFSKFSKFYLSKHLNKIPG